jgi:hypothetical protein
MCVVSATVLLFRRYIGHGRMIFTPSFYREKTMTRRLCLATYYLVYRCGFVVLFVDLESLLGLGLFASEDV